MPNAVDSKIHTEMIFGFKRYLYSYLITVITTNTTVHFYKNISELYDCACREKMFKLMSFDYTTLLEMNPTLFCFEKTWSISMKRACMRRS